MNFRKWQKCHREKNPGLMLEMHNQIGRSLQNVYEIKHKFCSGSFCEPAALKLLGHPAYTLTKMI